jgi:hypothetical protein
MIEELLSKVVSFNEALTSGRAVSEIIKDNEAFICDMNAQVQLYEQGVNRLSVSIMDYQPYAESTIAYKKRKGQPYDRVTLRDTGAFHASFYITTTDKDFEIKARDEKTQWLTKRYGNQILGLTEEHVAEVAAEYVYPELMDKLIYTLNG